MLQSHNTLQETWEEGSQNVFSDLGFSHADEKLIKAELAFAINKLLKKRKLTQKEAGRLLDIDQPKVSALSRGRLEGFSIERLFKFLIHLNQDIEIIIKPHPFNAKSSDEGHFLVTYATA